MDAAATAPQGDSPASARNVLNVGTRDSPLALAQTEIVVASLKALFPDISFQICGMKTTGDKDQNTALYNFGGKALWTSQLEEKLASEELDMVVHSLKDMPTTLPEGCALGCVTNREDPRDTLVIKKELVDKHGWRSLADLPEGSVIGTSSVRRMAQLRRRYPGLKFKDHRGNIQTRLRKLDESEELSGTILAAAGLQRMDLDAHISQFFDLDNGGILHAVGQGALGVECREGDVRVREMLKKIEDSQTSLACIAERSLMRTLEGGCSVPIGVETHWIDGRLRLRATVVSVDGSEAVDSETLESITTPEAADEYGKRVAKDLRDKGADKILDALTLGRAQGDSK